MTIADGLRAEHAFDAKATRKMLALAPDDRFDWKPHEKSMTLRQLICHIAQIPSWIGLMATTDELDLAGDNDFTPFVADDSASVVAQFDQSVAAFDQELANLSDQDLFVPWTLRNGDKIMSTMPRMAAIRGWILTHNVHHRGQLSVYLRLLDIPLPQVLGPTADNPEM